MASSPSPSRPSFPSFPPELISLFIDNLVFSEREHEPSSKLKSIQPSALKNHLLACSLVSRTFRIAALKCLFAVVSIGDYQHHHAMSAPMSTSAVPQSPNRARRRSPYEIFSRLRGLIGLLDSAKSAAESELGRAIRRLKLWIAPEFIPMVYILKDLVRAINSRAPNLRAIFLCGLHWSEISADVTQSLLDLLLRPSIVRLELHDMTGVPRRIISDCVSLQFLELNANFIFAPAPPGASLSESGICDYLRLAGKYQFAPGSKTRVEIFQLEHFEMKILNQEQMRELEQLFRAASSLVSFNLLISSKPNFDNFVHFSSTTADPQSLYLLRDVHLELGWGDGALSLAQSFIQGMPADLTSFNLTFTADILWFQYPFHEIRPVNIAQQFLRTRFPGLREGTVRLKLGLTTLSEPFSPLRLGVDEKRRMEDVFRAKIGSLSRAALEDSDLIHPTIVVEMRGAEDLE